jgi:DNA-binding transcriptional MerR regulator
MIKIGDFSKLSLVSIKTLRYYDEMGLLKPVHVDQFTGYRYYSADQLSRLHRILALKDLGFSLEQIARVLNEGVSAEQLRGMLRLRQAEAQQHQSSFCPSARAFAPRFFQTSPHGDALALRYHFTSITL